MNTINMDAFYTRLAAIIDTLEEKEGLKTLEAAELCAQSIADGGVIQVFGSGHSIGYVMEMSGRPGSLIPVNKMNSADFVIKGVTTLEDYRDPNNKFERRPGVGDKFYELYDIRPQDCFIIISNSGINGIGIDLAIKAKENGHKIIVITSWQHTSVESSRHPSGKKLYEFADVIIDNCGPQGDALLSTNTSAKVCAISSLTGAFIGQSLTLEICNILKSRNLDLPILLPEDTEKNVLLNRKWLERYQGRID